MNIFSELVPAIHAVSTIFMTGLIWFVQLVHYPLFKYVDREQFIEFERQHQKRTTWIVAPIMLLEVATAAILLLSPPSESAAVPIWIGMGFLTVIWLCTGLVQMPLHQTLERGGYSEQINKRLIQSNWIRTFAWSARTILSVLVLDSFHAGG